MIIIFLVNLITNLREECSDRSLKVVLIKTLPYEMSRAIDPAGAFTLDYMLQELVRRVNSSSLLKNEKHKIERFKRETAKTSTEGLMKFVQLVGSFNLRCQAGDIRWQRKVWSMNRLLHQTTIRLIPDVFYRVEFHKLWNT